MKKINSFIDQYHERWVNYGESNQFARAGPIDNNNGLETIDKDMKNIRVLRDKQKIGSLIINALTITEGWGIKDNSRVYFSNGDLVTLEEQNNGQILKKREI